MQLQEHDKIEGVDIQDKRFDHLNLVSWDRPTEGCQWGYYASYKIGAEWIDDKETLIVTTKRGMEHIDFLSMFMICFTSNLAVESFSQIYSISAEQQSIKAPSLKGVVSPLIIMHFLGVVSRIKALRKGYVRREENLKKVKGHINILKNERANIALQRYDRIYCNYDEYTIDIPENRLLKKALLFSKRLLSMMDKNHFSYNRVWQKLSQTLAKFENVSCEVDIKAIRQIKGHKLFKDYAEAIRLAKLVLRHFDYSINNVSNTENKVTPFVLDMSLLYEHYVYGLLYEAYDDKITYQYEGKTGIPDFLYCTNGFKAILDTKYIPKYDEKSLDINVIRQLSGYGRDLRILKKIGYDATEDELTPSVPCVIIYPTETGVCDNPFLGKELSTLCTIRERGLSQFYKISIPIPTLK